MNYQENNNPLNLVYVTETKPSKNDRGTQGSIDEYYRIVEDIRIVKDSIPYIISNLSNSLTDDYKDCLIKSANASTRLIKVSKKIGGSPKQEWTTIVNLANDLGFSLDQ
jgi:hypothetical protein